MLVLARGRQALPGWHGSAAHAFFVECDGDEHHGLASGNLREDLRREVEIRRETNLDLLRFSGAEIDLRPHQVHQVLAARVEAMAALHEFGEDLRHGIGRVLRLVGTVSCHPALRVEDTVRNRPAAADPYDPFDSAGEQYDCEAGFDPALEPFEGLRDALARLRHAVALLRRGGGAWEDEDDLPAGRFQPLGHVIDSILARRGRDPEASTTESKPTQNLRGGGAARPHVG
jgi:hypothetical protein